MTRTAAQSRAIATLQQAFAYFRGASQSRPTDKLASDTALDQMYAYFG